MLRSRILIFTHGLADFQPYFPKKIKGRIYFNLFHAIAVKSLSKNLTEKEKISINEWDYFLVSSDFESRFIHHQFGISYDKLLTLGQPRNDVIITKHKLPRVSEKKMVLYAPTFRDNSIVELFPFKDINLKLLDDFLGTHNFEIMIRLHVNDENKYKFEKKYQNLNNIYFTGSDKIPSINDFLYKVDFLITDYSSIALDFLLLDRPIAYIPYDFDEYLSYRGFSFDFYKHTAGPILKSQVDLISFLEIKDDDYKTKRNEMKNLFHKHQNGRSSNNIYEFIKTL